MVAGLLQVTGDGASEVAADFTYENGDWGPPAVRYSVDSTGRADLFSNSRLRTAGPCARAAASGRFAWIQISRLI
jgi:hypothetical protein